MFVCRQYYSFLNFGLDIPYEDVLPLILLGKFLKPL